MALILVVDDRPGNRDYLVTLLGYRGHRLLEADDGAEALALVRAERPALVITDVLMPVMDGFEFVRRLRADPEVALTPVIFYTAEYQSPGALALAVAGGVHQLIKPAEPEEILRVVERTLGLEPAAAPPPPDPGFEREHLRLLTDSLACRVDLLESAHRRQAVLVDLGQRALAGVELSTLLGDAVRLVTRALGVEYGGALELLPGGDALLLRAGVGWEEGAVGRATVGAGAGSQADFTLLCREAVIVEDLHAEVRFAGTPLLLEHGVTCSLGVVIPGHDRPFGILGAHTARRRDFSREEGEFLQAVANLLAAAIEQRRVVDERNRVQEQVLDLNMQLEHRLEQIAALRRIDIAITASLDLRLILEIVLDQTVAILGVAAAAILLLEPDTTTLFYSVGRGFRGRGIIDSQVRLGEGYAGLAALERHRVIVPDLTEVGDACLRAKLLSGEGFVAYYAVPLLAKGQLKGALEVFSRNSVALDQDRLDFLEALAGQAAIAVDGASLFETIQRANLELMLAYDATIEGWSAALDLRDKETKGHSRRVTAMTMRLARAMGVAGAELVHARRGALLHDIGKLGIPDAILHKPGPLTDEEWVIMRRHPMYAHEGVSQPSDQERTLRSNLLSY